MSDVTYDLNGYLAAQVDAFSRALELRDQARDIAAQLEGELAFVTGERDDALLRLDQHACQVHGPVHDRCTCEGGLP